MQISHVSSGSQKPTTPKNPAKSLQKCAPLNATRTRVFPGKPEIGKKTHKTKTPHLKPTHSWVRWISCCFVSFVTCHFCCQLPTGKKTRMLYTPMKYWFFNRDPNDLWNHHITMSKMSWTHYQDFSLQVTFPWPTCISQEEAWDMAELHPMAQAPSRSSSTFTSGWFFLNENLRVLGCPVGS